VIVIDGVFVPDKDPLGVDVREGERELDGVRDTVLDSLIVTDIVLLRVRVPDGDFEGVRVSLIVTVAVFDGINEALLVRDAVVVLLCVGEGVPDRENVGEAVAVLDEVLLCVIDLLGVAELVKVFEFVAELLMDNVTDPDLVRVPVGE
jgi:hypothetical protein